MKAFISSILPQAHPRPIGEGAGLHTALAGAANENAALGHGVAQRVAAEAVTRTEEDERPLRIGVFNSHLVKTPHFT